MRHGRCAGWQQATMHSEPLVSDSACSRQMTGRVTDRIVDKSCSVILRAQRPKLTRKIG
jgi:hypothetical protein